MPVSSGNRMHADEVATDPAMVRRLLEAQFPEWAELPIERVQSAGTDNAIYRLGDDLAVRMPRIPSATSQVDKEARWLPVLAPHLPLAVPVPLAVGEPGEGYPWRWSVNPWLPGENATLDRITDPHQAALDLAALVTAMQQIDTTGGPRAGTHNFSRGVPLALRDRYTREGLAGLHGMIDVEAATAAWESALRVPAWQGEPVWLHGDIQSGNLLALDGRIHAIIDFGCLAVGDPAVDLIVAWHLLTPETRPTFRAALDVDDDTWARGRGWALSVSLVALPYYHITNPTLAGISRYTIEQVLLDHQSGV